MSDPGELEKLKASLHHGWLNEDQGRFCYVQSQLEKRSALDIAVQQGYLSLTQINQLRSSEGPLTAPLSPESQSPEIGHVFDGFLLTRELGRGGMGLVYQGRKNGAEYALKFLLTDLDGAERFEREAAALAKVDRHPNVVRIHSYRQVGAHRYLVFDLLQGGDLRDRLSKQIFKEEEALTMLSQLANALTHIHKHGFLHRDLKPENILFDDHDQAKISDFGLAYSIGLETLTMSGEALGTPAYMAPEQFEGSRNKLCPGTDVWALGAILYELLCGKKAFEGSTVLQYAHSVLTKAAPRIRRENSSISEGTENIILKALEKRPEDRFQSAAEFEQACLAVLNRRYQMQALPSQLRQARILKRRVVALILLILLSITLYVFGRDIDEYFFQWRLSPELTTQIETTEDTVNKASERLPEAVAQLMLRTSGLKLSKPPVKASIPKDDKLLKDFDALVLKLKDMPRFFNNPQLEQLQQKRSAITHYWSCYDALTESQQIALASRLSKGWRSIFGAYQLFLKGDFEASKLRYKKLQRQIKELKEDYKFNDLCLLGLSLCEAKQKNWSRASRCFAQASSDSSQSWHRDWLLHITEQQALDLVLSDSNNEELSLSPEFEQCWTKLLTMLEASNPALVRLYWELWNEQINKALSNDLNSRTILLFCDFLAQYWLKKPEVIRPQFSHKELTKRLIIAFENGRSKGQKNIYGAIFNHFLSIRQFDRTFKTDLTFFLPKERKDQGVFGSIETEMDWCKKIARAAKMNSLSLESSKSQRKDFLTLIFQTSLVASRQGLYLPISHFLLVDMEEAGILSDAVKPNRHTVDPYPLFWSIQLNPIEFRKRFNDNASTVRRLFIRMYHDIEQLLNRASLPPRFQALILRKKAQWHYAALIEVQSKSPCITLKDFRMKDTTQLQSVLQESLKKAIALPHFRPDKAFYDCARMLPSQDRKRRVQFFRRALAEFEKRQERTANNDFYVGRKLSEVILPVRDYKISKARYLIHSAEALRDLGSFAEAIEFATLHLKEARSPDSSEKIIAECFVELKRWSDLEQLLKKKNQRNRQRILQNLFSRAKNNPSTLMELKKRYRID